MIDQILPIITDSADYMTALSFFQEGSPLTKAVVDRLLPVYEKYLEAESDPDYAKMCFAVDLLPGRTRADAADFAALELGDRTLDALFFARELSKGRAELPVETADAVAKWIRDDSVSLPVRVLLARSALNTMAGALNFVEIQDQVRAAAEFLTGVGAERLDRYTALAREVRMKC